MGTGWRLLAFRMLVSSCCILLKLTSAFATETHFGCSLNPSENENCPISVPKSAYNVLNGRVGIRTAATGASVSGRLKIGTPLALSTIGEMNVQIDFSAVAQPCDVSDMTLELGATLQIKMKEGSTCRMGNLIDCVYSAAKLMDENGAGGLARQFAGLCHSIKAPPPARRRGCRRRGYCDASCNCDDESLFNKPVCKAAKLSCQAGSAVAGAAGDAVDATGDAIGSVAGAMADAAGSAAGAAGSAAAGAAQATGDAVISTGQAVIDMTVQGTDSVWRSAQSSVDDAFGGLKNTSTCDYIEFNIDKWTMRADLKQQFPTLRLSDIIDAGFPNLGIVLRALGTDVHLKIDQNSFVSSFGGVQFAVLSDVYVIDRSMMFVDNAAAQKAVQAIARAVGVKALFRATDWNVLDVAFNIGPQLVKLGAMKAEELQPFEPSFPSFLSKRRGFVTIGDVSVVCSKKVVTSTLSFGGASSGSVTSDEIAKALSTAINDVLSKNGVALRVPNCEGQTEDTARRVCLVQDIVVSGRSATFKTNPGAGKNAGGLNAALQKAIDAGLSIGGRTVDTDATVLAMCTQAERKTAAPYKGCEAAGLASSQFLEDATDAAPSDFAEATILAGLASVSLLLLQT